MHLGPSLDESFTSCYVLLVLRLGDQPLAGVVCVTVSCRLGQTLQSLLTISLALSPATVLDLEAREVGVRLDFLDEGHLYAEWSVPVSMVIRASAMASIALGITRTS